MTTNANGLTAPHSQPVKKTYKQDRHFTLNKLKNQPVRHQGGDTLRPGAINTLIEPAVAAFAEKKAFSRPEIFGTAAHGRGSSWLMGLGAVNRKATGTAGSVLIHPVPPDDLSSHSAGFAVQPGTGTMKSTTTGATAQTTHDHHQAALVLRAQNHLALALFELRNSTGDTPARKAMGLAYAAGRALSQVVGGAV